MSSGLLSVSGRATVKALSKRGFVVKRQSGSHVVLRRDDPFAQLVVPDHRELDRGTLSWSFPTIGSSIGAR